MVIVAHPDDPEFFCGGTIALWCAHGTEMSYLILTNGNKGSDDPDMTPEKLAAIRKEEQQAAWYTLHQVMRNILKILSPITPFITDYIWMDLYSISLSRKTVFSRAFGPA